MSPFADQQLENVTGAGYSFQISLVPWDSEVFGFPVAQIERIAIAPGAKFDALIRDVLEWLRSRKVNLASCRLPGLHLRESMTLEDAGFRFVEMVYKPTLTQVLPDRTVDPELVISDAQSADLSEIETIAGSAFSTGRYLLDWRLDGEASHKRYRIWVRRAFSEKGQRVLKVSIGRAIVGFFIVEDRSDGSTYWHLTAIAPAWQGKRIGKRVWAAMASLHAASGRSSIETTISAHNAPVMNIYAGLGFRFGAPQMTLHWVRR